MVLERVVSNKKKLNGRGSDVGQYKCPCSGSLTLWALSPETVDVMTSSLIMNHNASPEGVDHVFVEKVSLWVSRSIIPTEKDVGHAKKSENGVAHKLVTRMMVNVGICDCDS
jgi:hypothetical protein